MCKLFDRLNQGVLDVRVVNKKADETAAKVENWNLVIGSARSVGCRGLHIVQVPFFLSFSLLSSSPLISLFFL